MRNKFLYIPVLALMLLHGCISTDRSLCNPGFDVSFEYVHNNEGTDLFSKEVDKVTVFVFDKEDNYLDTYTEKTSNIVANGNKLSLPLQVGEYTLLTWGGPMSSYTVGDVNGAALSKGSTNIADFRIRLKANGTRSDDDAPVAMPSSPLFYGKNRITVAPDEIRGGKISLSKNTSNIVIRIRDISENPPANPGGGSPFEVYCIADNTMFDSNNSIPDGDPLMRHLPSRYEIKEGPVYEAFIDMNRLVIGHRAQIRVWDIPENSFIPLDDDDLINIIRSNPKYTTQDAIDKEDLFEIEFTVKRSGISAEISVTVTINGWVIEKLNPEPES